MCYYNNLTDKQFTDTQETPADALKRLDRIAWYLDASIRLPGGFRIGADGLIGLIPGIGDLTSFAISSYIVNEARRLGAPKRLLAKMLANIAVESMVGIVPVIGDAFDFYYKANIRNVELLRSWLLKSSTLNETQPSH